MIIKSIVATGRQDDEQQGCVLLLDDFGLGVFSQFCVAQNFSDRSRLTLMASIVASTCAISIMVVAVMSNNSPTTMAEIATSTAVGYSTVGYIKHR